MSFTVGQEVLITRPYGAQNEPVPMTVRKVGRSYVYVGRDDRERSWLRFSMDTRAESLPGGYVGGMLYTPQEWAERRLRFDLVQELRDLGVESTHGRRAYHRASVSQLRAIVDILRGEGK